MAALDDNTLWSLVEIIINAGLREQTDTVKVYTNILITELRNAGDTLQAERILRVIEGTFAHNPVTLDTHFRELLDENEWHFGPL